MIDWKFQPGDKVICIKDLSKRYWNIPIVGRLYTVSKLDYGPFWVYLSELGDTCEVEFLIPATGSLIRALFFQNEEKDDEQQEGL